MLFTEGREPILCGQPKEALYFKLLFSKSLIFVYSKLDKVREKQDETLQWFNPTTTFQASGKSAWILKKTARENQILQKCRDLENSLGL